MIRCSKGHAARETSRKRVKEAVEDVVYKKERIKHFDREGSEFWTEIEVPDIVVRELDVEVVEYRCDQCGENDVIRRCIEGP
jgi:hypothetical protein